MWHLRVTFYFVDTFTPFQFAINCKVCKNQNQITIQKLRQNHVTKNIEIQIFYYYYLIVDVIYFLIWLFVKSAWQLLNLYCWLNRYIQLFTFCITKCICNILFLEFWLSLVADMSLLIYKWVVTWYEKMQRGSWILYQYLDEIWSQKSLSCIVQKFHVS